APGELMSLCAADCCELFPEGFHLGEIGMRLLGAVEQLIDIGFLWRQQLVRMVAEVMTIFDQRLALSEVVQRAELILQILPRRERRLAPGCVLFACEHPPEEFDPL